MLIIISDVSGVFLMSSFLMESTDEQKYNLLIDLCLGFQDLAANALVSFSALLFCLQPTLSKQNLAITNIENNVNILHSEAEWCVGVSEVRRFARLGVRSLLGSFLAGYRAKRERDTLVTTLMADGFKIVQV